MAIQNGGSFSWHFTNSDAVVQAALERWEVEDTEAAIAALEGINDSRERLQGRGTGDGGREAEADCRQPIADS